MVAMHSAVTSLRAVCKPGSSPSLSRSPSTNKLMRRRGRGSLVRSRAFIWSKEDLHKLHELAKRPRHEVTPDIVDDHTVSKSPSAAPSPDNSTCTDLHDGNYPHQTTFAGAVEQQVNQHDAPPSQNEPSLCSMYQSPTPLVQPPKVSVVTASKPPSQHMSQWNHPHSEMQKNTQLASHSHHFVRREQSVINPSNLAVVSGLTARLIDLKL